MQISYLNLCNFKVDGGAMFGTLPKTQWIKNYSANPQNLVTLALQSMVIEFSNRVILIDTGFAPINSQQPNTNEYNITEQVIISEAITKLGYKPTDITDVIHTHLHIDHCGGSFTFTNNRFEPVFPKANYWVSAQQLENALNPTGWEELSFNPQIIKAFKNYHLTRWIDKSQHILPWLQCRLYFGHTPGLIVPVIFNNNQSIIFCGDLIPTRQHITLNCISAFDINPSLVFEEKKLLNEELKKGNCELVFQHQI